MEQDLLLQKLAKGAMLLRREDGAHVLGRRRVDELLVRRLCREELLQPLAGGRYALTGLGQARVKRIAAGMRRGKAGNEDDSFRLQHQVHEQRLRSAREGHGAVTVNVAESPLQWLGRRKNARGRAFLQPHQVEAGERLRSDFELAALSPRVTAAWSGQPVSDAPGHWSEMEPGERQIAARQRFHKATDALGAPLSDVVVRVCCFLQGLEQVEQHEGWPVRSGKVVLAIALERLAAHYGIVRAKSAK